MTFCIVASVSTLFFTKRTSHRHAPFLPPPVFCAWHWNATTDKSKFQGHKPNKVWERSLCHLCRQKTALQCVYTLSALQTLLTLLNLYRLFNVNWRLTGHQLMMFPSNSTTMSKRKYIFKCSVVLQRKHLSILLQKMYWRSLKKCQIQCKCVFISNSNKTHSMDNRSGTARHAYCGLPCAGKWCYVFVVFLAQVCYNLLMKTCRSQHFWNDVYCS